MLYLEAISELEKPTGSLFLEDSIYDYQRWIAYCTSLYNTGEREDAAALASRVLAAGKLPDTSRPVLERIAASGITDPLVAVPHATAAAQMRQMAAEYREIADEITAEQP